MLCQTFCPACLFFPYLSDNKEHPHRAKPKDPGARVCAHKHLRENCCHWQTSGCAGMSAPYLDIQTFLLGVKRQGVSLPYSLVILLFSGDPFFWNAVVNDLHRCSAWARGEFNATKSHSPTVTPSPLLCQAIALCFRFSGWNTYFSPSPSACGTSIGPVGTAASAPLMTEQHQICLLTCAHPTVSVRWFYLITSCFVNYTLRCLGAPSIYPKPNSPSVQVKLFLPLSITQVDKAPTVLHKHLSVSHFLPPSFNCL